MKDRVPTYPGRVQLTPVPGQANTYDMTRADAPTQAGDALCKANLLPDDVVALMGLTQANPQIKDAILGAFTQGGYLYEVTVKCNGNPVSGVAINGLSSLPRGKTVTDNNGLFIGLSASQNPAVSIDTSAYIDAKSYTGTLTSTGDITSAEIDLQTNTPGEIVYTSSKTVKFASRVLVDVHCISAGKNGGSGYYQNILGAVSQGGNGGSAGGQAYATGVAPTPNTAYDIIVPAANGGTASAFGVAAPSIDSSATVGKGANFVSGASTNTDSTAGSSSTTKKYGTGAIVGGGAGGGGGNTSYAGKAGGAPFGGAGGAGTSSGANATGYGGGGGGGGADNFSLAGGNGYQGVVFMLWRYAS